jgi:hypothetical protein
LYSRALFSFIDDALFPVCRKQGFVGETWQWSSLKSPVLQRTVCKSWLTKECYVYTVQFVRNIIISSGVLEKLSIRHKVEQREVEQCFENLIGLFLEDSREDHRTDPPTLWFISPTNKDRLLKVVFIFIDSNVHIKSVFEPNAEEISIYDRFGR